MTVFSLSLFTAYGSCDLFEIPLYNALRDAETHATTTTTTASDRWLHYTTWNEADVNDMVGGRWLGWVELIIVTHHDDAFV